MLWSGGLTVGGSIRAQPASDERRLLSDGGILKEIGQRQRNGKFLAQQREASNGEQRVPT